MNFSPPEKILHVPVENRFSFTDLNELNVVAEIGNWKTICRANLAPMSQGEIEVPVPRGTTNGSLLVLRFFDAQTNLITADGIRLGRALAPEIPKPHAGCPQWEQNEKIIRVHGDEFDFAIDRTSAAIVTASRNLALKNFPVLHVTRLEEKNAFNPNGLPFARYPDESSRVIDSVIAEKRADGLAVIVRDHYKNFQGSVEMLLDKNGNALVSFDYIFSGETFKVSEAGLRFLFDERCDEISWRRQTEWDVYPDDHIGRPEGRARAHAPGKWSQTPPSPFLSAPSWPWYLDANEMGTRDFRATKYTIYEAALLAQNDAGIRVFSNGEANVRSCLAKDGVQFHTLLAAPPAQLAKTNHLSGIFSVRLSAGISTSAKRN
jgi:beta-galactosidase